MGASRRRSGERAENGELGALQPGTIEEFVRREASRRGIRLPRAGAAVLTGLDYGLECELKDRALHFFWKRHGLPGTPEKIVPSPRPRHYRTTSKRRCRYAAGSTAESVKNAPARMFIAAEGAEQLEPEEHARIFSILEKGLSAPRFAPLARALNFLVIRGSYEAFMVIFNLQRMDRGLHALLLEAASMLREPDVNVVSAFLVIDPSRSPYYLEADRPRASLQLKKLFGPENFRLRVGETIFSIPPTSFSQVNESLLPLLMGNARELMARGSGERLLDLYCGYGLFAFGLSSRYREVIAVDAAAPSIRAGRGMLASAPSRPRIRFRVASISRNTLEKELPPPLAPGMEDVVIDPPRGGADGAVIRSIARRRPGCVLHLFCASEEIPGAVGHWRRNGYYVRRIIPLDMFAGTFQLETLLLLTRA